MRITINIGGREALPLRAIPYVTSWNEAPDGLVSALLGERGNVLTAYKADMQARYVPVPASQWKAWRVTLASLTVKLKADERKEANNENWGPWRIEAVLKLPDDVFVWLDEFQAWYSMSRPFIVKGQSNVSMERLTALGHMCTELGEGPHTEILPTEMMGSDEAEVEFEREDDNLCLTPILPSEIDGKVWRYPDPLNVTSREATEALAAPAVREASAQNGGLTKPQIMAAEWPLSGDFTSESLGRALSDVPGWLTDARVSLGAPGKRSSTWNPAAIAECLATKHYANRSALSRFIRDNFPEWQETWNEIQDSD